MRLWWLFYPLYFLALDCQLPTPLTFIFLYIKMRESLVFYFVRVVAVLCVLYLLERSKLWLLVD